ncbi:hypothetical protein RN001_001937 [Aquatica leii]|uniref:Uncharacterized protein n=1 Tax=Aquatica leii TaxID=1421715 RepID=A0AAN7PP85_9COLE|nr:hypothetical protein RN001_001937 [Aquatica leii]
MPKALQQQSRELVSLLINYFEQEKNNGGPLLSLNCVRERVCQALQISMTTVSGISAAAKRNEVLSGPSKHRQRQQPVRSIDTFTSTAIRNAVYKMYQESKFNLLKEFIYTYFRL